VIIEHSIWDATAIRRLTTLKVDISTDGSTYTQVDAGKEYETRFKETYNDGSRERRAYVYFQTPVNARYVKIKPWVWNTPWLGFSAGLIKVPSGRPADITSCPGHTCTMA
jgi:hypothetical protein